MFANVPMPGSEEPITGESLISRFNNWDGSSAKEIIQSKIGNDQGAAKIKLRISPIMKGRFSE